jgi:hypothetical protein
MRLIKRVEILLLIAQWVFSLSLLLVARAIEQQVNHTFGGRPIDALAELYFRSSCWPYVAYIVAVVACYVADTYKREGDRVAKNYCIISLSVTLLFVSGYISAAVLALFTVQGSIYPK